VSLLRSHWLNRELIEIGRFLREQKSSCHYNDYVNVFKARNGSRISVESICRALRKLREKGVFFTPPKMRGQFFISDRLLQPKEVTVK
jgi:hypothetical protein